MSAFRLFDGGRITSQAFIFYSAFAAMRLLLIYIR